MRRPVKQSRPASLAASRDYSVLVSGVSELLEAARRASARTVNAFMTATYWEVGRRIVEFEQGGENRAEYGKKLIERLSTDLTRRFGCGFGQRNVEGMRQFFLVFPTSSVQARLSQSGIPQSLSADLPAAICQTPSGESADAIRSALSSISETPSRIFQTPSGRLSRPPWALADLARAFPLPWSPYVLLVQRTRSSEAFAFYHEYSEIDLEDALIRHLETFLLELGNDFAFVGRQRRLCLDDEWYRVDLRFFHRRLRCLVILDLKLGRFSHADAGQMHLYLNCAREHWMQPGENPPVGVILFSGKSEAQGVKANVLFFDRKPAQEKPWTQKLWINDLRTHLHFTLKEHTLKRSDLDDFVACYCGAPREGTRPTSQSTPHPGPLPGRGGEGRSRHNRVETERFKSFPCDDLLKRVKVNLDIFWRKDDALEETANLPAPNVIAQEIADDLEAALEQFATIAEDLKG